LKVSVPDLDDCRLILRPTLLHNAIQLPRMHRILDESCGNTAASLSTLSGVAAVEYHRDFKPLMAHTLSRALRNEAPIGGQTHSTRSDKVLTHW